MPVPSTIKTQLPKGLTRRSGSGPYWADFFWHGYRIRMSTGCHHLGDAVRVLEQWQRNGPPDRQSRTIAHQGLDDLVTLIQAEEHDGRLRPASAIAYREKIALLRRYAEDRREPDIHLRHIDRRFLEGYMAWRRHTPISRNGRANGDLRPPSERTVNNDLDLLRAVFRRAIKQGWMTAEPTAEIPRNRQAQRPRIRHISPEDMARLFLGAQAVIDDRQERGRMQLPWLVDLLEVILGLGLRRQEALTLCRKDIDLQQDLVHIRPKCIPLQICLPMDNKAHRRLRHALDKGRRPTSPRLPEEIPTGAIDGARYDRRRGLLLITDDYRWQPKSHHQGRVIPIPFRLRSKLQDLLAPTLRDRFPHDPVAACRREVGFDEPPLLFCGREGGILRHNLNNLVIESAKRAGIVPPRLHDLRHSYATWLRRNGTELATIQRLLGHQDLKTTLAYADFTIEEGRRAVSGLDW